MRLSNIICKHLYVRFGFCPFQSMFSHLNLIDNRFYLLFGVYAIFLSKQHAFIASNFGHWIEHNQYFFQMCYLFLLYCEYTFSFCLLHKCGANLIRYFVCVSVFIVVYSVSDFLLFIWFRFRQFSCNKILLFSTCSLANTSTFYRRYFFIASGRVRKYLWASCCWRL